MKHLHPIHPIHPINYVLLRQIQEIIELIVADDMLDHAFRHQEVNPCIIKTFGRLYNFETEVERREYCHLFSEFMKLFSVIQMLIRDVLADANYLFVNSINYLSIVYYLIDNNNVICVNEELELNNVEIGQTQQFLYDLVMFDYDIRVFPKSI